MRITSAGLLGAFIMLTASLGTATEDPYKTLDLIRPKRVEKAKEFRVASPTGKTLRLSDYSGQAVLLNFWATWCPPCREEMPAMERLYRHYKDRGFLVVALSVDSQGAHVVIPFVKEHKLTFPIGLDPKKVVAEQYGMRVLPSSFIVNKKGALVAVALGSRQWDSKAAYAVIESLVR